MVTHQVTVKYVVTDRDTPSDRRTATNDDTSCDKMTHIDKSSGKTVDTASDDSKRTDTEGDEVRSKRTEDITHKETRSIGTSTKEQSNNNKTIIELYRKRMKENKSGHKLKFLRPELVKAFIQ